MSYLITIIDLLIVFFICYHFLITAWNHHAYKTIKGLFFLICIYFVSHLLHLPILTWTLEKCAPLLMVAVLIIFQPELRRMLEWMGSTRSFFHHNLNSTETKEETLIIKHILRALEILTREKIGALIVIEISNNLSQYSQSGVAVNSTISAEVLASLFWPGAPTHDGAVILRQGKIESAGCLLPLTDTKIQDRRLGTRHRAALGLSELTDALIFVVSEETGIISMAENGKLTRYLNKEAIETRLFNLYKETYRPS